MSSEIEESFIFVVPNISGLTDQHRFSKTHYIGNIPWIISVRTETIKDVKYFSVYLHCNSGNDSPMWKVEGIQTMIVLSQLVGAENSEKCCQFSNHSKSRNLGWSSFIKWDDLMDPKNGYVKDDSIQVSASIIITKVVGLPSFGYNFEKASSFSDVVLVVEGKQLHANASYLSMVSPVLKTSLHNNNVKRKRSSSNQQENNLELKDVEYSEFLVFLAAVYNIPSTINENNVELLLKLANRFEVAPVIHQCEQLLLSSTTITMSKKFMLADMYCLANLNNFITKSLKVADIELLKNDKGYKDLTEESKDALFETTLTRLKEYEKK